MACASKDPAKKFRNQVSQLIKSKKLKESKWKQLLEQIRDGTVVISDIQPEFSWCILPLKVGGGDELFFILMEEYDKIQSETLESRMDSGSYKTVLCEAIKMKRIEVVKRLWKWKQRCQLSARDIHGLLHQLVQHDDPTLVELQDYMLSQMDMQQGIEGTEAVHGIQRERPQRLWTGSVGSVPSEEAKIINGRQIQAREKDADMDGSCCSKPPIQQQSSKERREERADLGEKWKCTFLHLMAKTQENMENPPPKILKVCEAACKNSNGRACTATVHRKHRRNLQRMKDKVYDIPLKLTNGIMIGYLLLINVKTFDNPDKNRDGSEKDAEEIRKSFQNLGFRLYRGEAFSDLTSHQIRETVKEFATDSCQRQAKVSVVVIMSHGGSDGHIYGSDLATVSIKRDIMPAFANDNAIHLKGKPKLFFCQACRGSGNTTAIMETDNVEFDADTRSLSSAMYSDILSVYPNVNGYTAMRHTLTGSPFIQVICRLLNNKETTNRYEVKQILNLAGETLRESKNEVEKVGPVIQTLETTDTGMTKSLYFPER